MRDGSGWRGAVRRASPRTLQILYFVLAISLLAHCSQGPTVHDDGEGPVAFANGLGGGATVHAYRVDGDGRFSNGPWTFGTLTLCLVADGPPARLLSVEPAQVQGHGSRVAHVALRQLEDDEDQIGNIYGPPPNGSAPVPGAEVTHTCDEPHRHELLVSLAAVGSGGGGWSGQRIRYEHEGREHVLLTEFVWILCGTDFEEACERDPSRDHWSSSSEPARN